MIISSANNLSGILRGFKKFTSKELIRVIGRINESRRSWMLDLFSEVAYHLKRVKNYKVWQDGNHPEILTSAKFTQQKLNYLHKKPVADEIVHEPKEYRYSSARDYYSSKKGYLELTKIE
jgi:hypothetical protein